MKRLTAAIASLCLMTVSAAAAEGMTMQENMRRVAPALEKYTQGTVLGDLWKRPGLSPRDRSVVTVAALVARNQTVDILIRYIQSRARRRRQARRNLRNHHPSRVLLGLGECHVRCCGRSGYL